MVDLSDFTLNIMHVIVITVVLSILGLAGVVVLGVWLFRRIRRASKSFAKRRKDIAARKQEAKDRKQAAKAQQEEDQLTAVAPRSPYHPALSALIPKIPDDWREIFLEAVADLDNYNMLQPPNASNPMQAGSKARQAQWNRIVAGRKTNTVDLMWVSIGLVSGAISGFIFGSAMPVMPGMPIPMSVVLSILLALLGAFLGHLYKSTSGGFHDGMMQVIVNERRSAIRREMVTAQAEAWIPKVLLFWRSEDWRYKDGRPYLWLQLPRGHRIQSALRGTMDYLELPNDTHRSKDAAVYDLRSWNRMISDNALDFADIDQGDTDGDSRLKGLMPWFFAGGLLVSGILLVLFTMD